MKRISLLAFFAFFAFAAFAEIAATALSSAPADAGGPARALAFQAVSTNLSGTVTVKRLSPLVLSWQVDVVTATTNYVEVATNLTKTVTNDIVTVWRTRHQGAGVVASNVYARAVNETPYYPPWPDIVVTTNKAEQTVAWTNWVERVVAGVSVTTNSETRFLRREFTNTLLSATLSGGYYHTNDVGAALMPGDRLVAEGTALNGGKAVIVIER